LPGAGRPYVVRNATVIGAECCSVDQLLLVRL
jgi:hypothetical protein